MLARIPTARRTLDADLYRTGYNKDQALSDLRRLAAVDLGDHFWFVYREHHAILAGDAQPYADGYRVTFDAYLGVKSSARSRSTCPRALAPPTVLSSRSRRTGCTYRGWPLTPSGSISSPTRSPIRSAPRSPTKRADRPAARRTSSTSSSSLSPRPWTPSPWAGRSGRSVPDADWRSPTGSSSHPLGVRLTPGSLSTPPQRHTRSRRRRESCRPPSTRSSQARCAGAGTRATKIGP